MFNKTFLRFTSSTVAVAHVISLIPAAALADTPAAGVTAANGNTQVYLAPNGVPVVNIANPNAAGVSHNQYTQYNVDARGLVLNNGAVDQISRQSQLAGQVLANTNLSKSAGVILNEVVSPDRSALAGFTEVLGGKADVVVANPFGITCSGCGFINADRVSLVTGNPRFAPSGAVAGFTVNGGDVLISGGGLNGTSQSYFDLVTRSLKVDGQINARTLNVVTGANDWDYALGGSATPIAGVGAAAAYAFDSTALGGIYADRIRIISTEAGVGVRMRGDAAATQADFSLDAMGRIELLGRLSAQRDVRVAYRGGASGGAGAITISGAGASVSGGGDVTISGGEGGVTLSEGSLNAGNGLSLSGNALTDASQASASRFGSAFTNLDFTGAVNVSGSVWGAGEMLSAQAGSFTLDGAGTQFFGGFDAARSGAPGGVSFVARTGDIDLGRVALKSPSTLALSASQGGIHIGASTDPLTADTIMLSAATGVTNASTVLADTDLLITAATLNNSGVLQAGGAVAIGSGVAATDLDNAGTILGDRVLIGANTLDNRGRIQAASLGSLMASSFTNSAEGIVLLGTQAGGSGAAVVTGALENAGSIHGEGTLGLSAATIHNAAGATVTAGSAVALTATNSVANEGAVQADTVSILAPKLTNNGGLQGRAALLISQGAAGAGTDARELTNGADGVVLGGTTLTIDAGAVSNSGVIQSDTNTSLTAVSLSNLAGAKILASTSAGGSGALSVTGAVLNDGLIHGASNLALSAGSLSNSGTAAISSLQQLSLSGLSGDITNAGLVYGAGGLLVTNPTHAFINSANVASGIPSSGVGTMTFMVDTFANTGTITSEGDMRIDTRDFRNDPVGGLPQIVNGPYIATEPVQSAGFTVPTLHQIGDSGDFHCDYATIPPSSCAHSRVYEAYFYFDQQLAGTMPKPAQLISSKDLTINYTGNARNVASIISGDTVHINAPLSAGAFDNRDFHLERTYLRKVLWIRSTNGDSFRVPLDQAQYDVMTDVNADEPGGSGPTWWIVPGQPTWEQNLLVSFANSYAISTGNGPVPGSTLTAGIFARDLASYHGPALNQQAGMKYANISRPGEVESAHGTAVGGPSAISQKGIDLTLPTNPNGFFVPSKGSGSGYLIETNPLYTSGDALGSDYLARLLGYNVDTLEKRLGDANYEAKLIREQLIAQTGSNILAGYASEKEQIQGLMESASTQASELGLTFGKALTPAQAAALKQDLVWMEEKEVGGQKVLVPVVYLAAATRDSVSTGAVISASNVSITGGGLTNTNSTVKAGNKLTVDTTGDITNKSGTITGGTVTLRTEGNVVNETTATVRGDDTYRDTTIGGTATLSAKDGLNIQAGKDVTIKGGDVNAGGAATIQAGGNVTVDTIENKTARSSASSSSGTWSTSSTSTNTQSTQQIGSNVNAGGNLTVKSGGDTTIAGSKVNAGGSADVQAGGNLNIIDRQNEERTTTRTESSGMTTDGASVGRESKSTTTTTTNSTSVGSTITSGGSANLEGGKTVTVKGSDVAAGGDLNVTGKDINVLAGTNTSTETVHEELSSTMLGASADADSVGVAVTNTTSTSDTSTTNTTARTSTLRSGGNMNRNASGTITDVGTQIEAGGDFSQKATTIDSRAAENTQSKTSSSHTEKVSVGASIDYGVGSAVDDAQNGSTAGAASAAGGPTAGTNVKYRKDDNSASESASQAVTSSIKSGGKVKSQSSGTTTLEGTQIQSGGDATLEAGDLNVKAAKDTKSSSSSASHVEAGYRGAVDVTGTPSGTISGGYGDANANSSESKAVVGTIQSGGNLNIRTKGDSRLEGTKVQSKGDTTVDAGGTVQMDAARNTSQSASSSIDISGSATVGKGQAGISGKLETNNATSQSSEAVTGSVAAGGNLNVRAGKDVKTEGTDISAGKDATVSAGGKVDLKDAVSTSDSHEDGIKASISMSGSKGGGSGKGGKNGNLRTEPGKGDPGQVMSGGGLSVTDETTHTETKKATDVKAGGNVKIEEKGGSK